MGNTQQSSSQINQSNPSTIPSSNSQNNSLNPIPYSQPIHEHKINHDTLKQCQTILLPSKNIMKIYFNNNYTQQQTNIWLKQIRKQKYQKGIMSHQFLLLPSNNNIESTASNSNLLLCGSSMSLCLVYECYAYVLIDQIRNRRRIYESNRNNSYSYGENVSVNGGALTMPINKYHFSTNENANTNSLGIFQQDQLWYILWSIIDAGKKLNQRGSKLGDIRPHNILFNQTGQIKIITPLSWPAQLTNYQKTLYHRTPTYLSPEQLQILSTGASTDFSGGPATTSASACNVVQAQSFSIGLTMLSLLFLQDMSKLYSRDVSSQYYGLEDTKLRLILQQIRQNIANRNSINTNTNNNNNNSNNNTGSSPDTNTNTNINTTTNTINTNINTNKMYSTELLDIIRKLCLIEVQQRLNYLRLWERIKQYKYDIVEFRKFDITNNSNNNSKNNSNVQVNVDNVNVNVESARNNNNNFKEQKMNINQNENKDKSNKIKSAFDTPMRILDGVLLQSNQCSPNKAKIEQQQIQQQQFYDKTGMHYHNPKVYRYPPPQTQPQPQHQLQYPHIAPSLHQQNNLVHDIRFRQQQVQPYYQYQNNQFVAGGQFYHPIHLKPVSQHTQMYSLPHPSIFFNSNNLSSPSPIVSPSLQFEPHSHLQPQHQPQYKIYDPSKYKIPNILTSHHQNTNSTHKTQPEPPKTQFLNQTQALLQNQHPNPNAKNQTKIQTQIIERQRTQQKQKKTPSKYQQHRQFQKYQQQQIISRIDRTLEKSKRLFPSASKNDGNRLFH